MNDGKTTAVKLPPSDNDFYLTLVDTEKVFEESGDLAITSEKLGVHPATLKRRLKKLKAIRSAVCGGSNEAL